MTPPPLPLGQRLRAWREANGLSIDDVAARLGFNPMTVTWAENQPRLGGDLRTAIESLIAPPPHTPPAADMIVEAVVEAVRAGLARGAQTIEIIQSSTATHGKITIILKNKGAAR